MSSSAEEAAEAFLSRQKRLESKLRKTRNPRGAYNGLKEAEEQFAKFPDVDNGRPTQQYLQVAIARRMTGMPGECPSEIKALAYGNLKHARHTLAEAYEAKLLMKKPFPYILSW